MIHKKRHLEFNPPTTDKKSRNEGVTPNLPIEIWTMIFSYAQFNTLASCALVCHDWHAIASTENIWKSLFLYHYSGNHFDLVELTEKQQLSWKQCYRDYSFFIKAVTHVKKCRTLQTLRKDALCPFVEHSDTKFYLDKNPKVILEEKPETQIPSVIFTAEASLTHLAVENHFLFALTNEGDVVSCDIETKSIQKLDKKETQAIRYKQSNSFVVHEGLVVKITDKALEVIPYAHPENSRVYHAHFYEPFLLISQIVNNHLYLVDQYSLSIWDLKNGEKIYSIELCNMLRFQFMCIKEDVVFLADQMTINLVNLKTNTVSSFMSIRPKVHLFPHAMHFLDDHFLMVYYEDTKNPDMDVFAMIDVRTKTFIMTSERSKNASIKK